MVISMEIGPGSGRVGKGMKKRRFRRRCVLFLDSRHYRFDGDALSRFKDTVSDSISSYISI